MRLHARESAKTHSAGRPTLPFPDRMSDAIQRDVYVKGDK
jgi:hypothetical protein